MKPELLVEEKDGLRKQWRDVRSMRLDIKHDLVQKGYSLIKMRHNSEYKKLKKEQKRISKMIKHVEKKILREIKNEA